MTEAGGLPERIRAVWFDVGETLIDESREYGAWADWLGVPRHTFSAVFGSVIARGGDYREAFQHFRPGFDLEAERQARLDAGLGEYLNSQDLYPDVRPALRALKDAGYLVGVAGNQTLRAGRFLRELNLPCDVLATSDDWGVTKPNPGFFEKLIAVSGYDRSEIAYVGDRLDWDIAPAAVTGLFTVWVRRGPWGQILMPDEAPVASALSGRGPDLTVPSLMELVPAAARKAGRAVTGSGREPRPGDPGYVGWDAEAHRILCAHADQEGWPAHWLKLGERCPDGVLLDPPSVPLESAGLRQLQDYLDQALPETVSDRAQAGREAPGRGPVGPPARRAESAAPGTTADPEPGEPMRTVMQQAGVGDLLGTPAELEADREVRP